MRYCIIFYYYPDVLLVTKLILVVNCIVEYLHIVGSVLGLYVIVVKVLKYGDVVVVVKYDFVVDVGLVVGGWSFVLEVGVVLVVVRLIGTKGDLDVEILENVGLAAVVIVLGEIGPV